MTRLEKLYQRMLATPTPSDVRHEELKVFLQSLGLVEVKLGKTSGSRIKFMDPQNPSRQIRLHKSHGDPPVDRGALKDVITRLRLMGFIE